MTEHTIDNASDEELEAFEGDVSSAAAIQTRVSVATSNTSLLEEELG